MTFDDDRKIISSLVSERMKFINANKEKLIEAWVAETGLTPAESCLVQQDIGVSVRIWVESQTDRCLTHRNELASLTAKFALAEKALDAVRNFYLNHEILGWGGHAGIGEALASYDSATQPKDAKQGGESE